MTKYFSIFLLITTVALTTNLRHISSLNHHSPSPSPSPPPPHTTTHPPPPPSPTTTNSPSIQQEQLKNIINALIGAGDFATWANILFNPTSNATFPTSSTSNFLPTQATLFVPGNDALSHLTESATGAYTFDPFIIPYHILPQRLSFNDLKMFKVHTRLPTLLPSKTIVITNNTNGVFSVDDALVMQPDLYTSGGVCVHGVDKILDYHVYGDAGVSLVPPPPAEVAAPPREGGEMTAPPEEVGSSLGVVKGVGLSCWVSFLIGICLMWIVN
ncbi:FAS1 domain-containing protein [Artemisia annua]|uniref:FAS1 domain-containing protein n=1 Tax=Artemisia annua TaxID=35608 RepID=A0A2U1PE57_ARTAN|nr:FAS1 domain-containing protein [Artemisia annua]